MILVLTNNRRIEDVSKQTFVGYVSECKELKHKFGGKGNDLTFRPELMQT